MPCYEAPHEDCRQTARVCRASALKSGEAERIAEWGREAFTWQDRCGVAHMGDWYMFAGDDRTDERVKERPQLKETLEWGYFEARACFPRSKCWKRVCDPVKVHEKLEFG